MSGLSIGFLINATNVEPALSRRNAQFEGSIHPYLLAVVNSEWNKLSANSEALTNSTFTPYLPLPEASLEGNPVLDEKVNTRGVEYLVGAELHSAIREARIEFVEDLKKIAYSKYPSLAALGRTINVAESTLVRVFKRERNPSEVMTYKLANALGLDFENLNSFFRQNRVRFNKVDGVVLINNLI